MFQHLDVALPRGQRASGAGRPGPRIEPDPHERKMIGSHGHAIDLTRRRAVDPWSRAPGWCRFGGFRGARRRMERLGETAAVMEQIDLLAEYGVPAA